jgi:drug/metabolite transporter (DMT)-like permease
MNHAPLNHSLRAILYALAGFTCWVIGDTFLKLSSEYGVPTYEIMIVGGMAGLAAIFIFTLVRGKIHTLHTRHYRVLSFLGFLFLASYVVWVSALSRLPLANFYTILFLAPTTAAIFAVLFLKEHLTLGKILAILAGFIGVVIAINPEHLFSDKFDVTGYAVALAGMLIVVTQMLTMRRYGRHISREALAFYPRLAAIGGGIAALIYYGYVPMPLPAFLYCAGAGCVGGIGWMLMAHAYKLAPAATVAPFHYSQIVTGGLIGYFIWNDLPSPHLLVGAAIIVASGLYIATRKDQTAQIAKTLVENP